MNENNESSPEKICSNNAELTLQICKNWIDDFNMEFGKSTCFCCICHESFLGYKHRVICKECGFKLSHEEI